MVGRRKDNSETEDKSIFGFKVVHVFDVSQTEGETLSDYEVRNWRGWHHHQVLSLIATWFLASEARWGKKYTPAITAPQVRDGIAMLLRAAFQCDTPAKIAKNKTRRLVRNEEARFYHYKARNRLPPTRLKQKQ